MVNYVLNPKTIITTKHIFNGSKFNESLKCVNFVHQTKWLKKDTDYTLFVYSQPELKQNTDNDKESFIIKDLILIKFKDNQFTTKNDNQIKFKTKKWFEDKFMKVVFVNNKNALFLCMIDYIFMFTQKGIF